MSGEVRQARCRAEPPRPRGAGSAQGGGGRGARQSHLAHVADLLLQLLACPPQLLALLLQLGARMPQPLVRGHVDPALLVELLPLGLSVLGPPRGGWGVRGQDTAASLPAGHTGDSVYPPKKAVDRRGQVTEKAGLHRPSAPPGGGLQLLERALTLTMSRPASPVLSAIREVGGGQEGVDAHFPMTTLPKGRGGGRWVGGPGQEKHRYQGHLETRQGPLHSAWSPCLQTGPETLAFN